jgi:MFS family permease
MTAPSTGGATAAADRNCRLASIALATTLPSDTVLYLLLPMYGPDFGLTLAEAGILLAVNRLIRILGYGWVARFYAKYGDRLTCMLAVTGAMLYALGCSVFSGFWLLLPMRLLWGLSYAALNLAVQALATSVPAGAAGRSGRSTALIAIGPMAALPVAALLGESAGPRWIFLPLVLAALGGLLAARQLPSRPHPALSTQGRKLSLPNALSVWSFLEGFTLDGLFVIGLSVLGRAIMPEGAAIAAGVLLALRYVGELTLSPAGGRLADRWGAERMLVIFSLLTVAALIGFGAGWLWSCAAAIVVLRALQLPLLAPIVARQNPGPERMQALASRSIWRDIGAGLGPMTAGFLLPVLPAVWLYAIRDE